MVCLQDLHWADPSTATFLRGVVEGLRGPVMVLGNYRPGYTPPPGMQLIELRELSPRQTGELLASLLQGEPPAALASFVAERSDGNPFYVEEVVKSLVETQVLVRSQGGWTLTCPLVEAGVPPTIRGVIAARIDRLDETRRRVLRHAAVVGCEFLYAVVALVTDDAVAVGPSLTQLQAADLIRARRPEPDLEYIFKHALTQGVAYDGLLKAERQVLHARTARAMDSVLADRIAYVTAWRTFTLFERERVAEAIRSGESLHQTEEERRRAPYPHFKSQFGLSVALVIAGDLRRAREFAERVIQLGRSSGSARAETLGHYALAIHWVLALDFERAAAAGEAGIASAKDPSFRAISAVMRAIAPMGDMRAEPALDLCNEWLPYLERNENYWFGQPTRQVRAGAELARGRLSDGLRDFLAGNRDLHARGIEANAVLSDGFLLLTYVSIARLDVKPALGALVSNPWFVFTQAPFAARRARSMIECFRAELPAKNMSGLLGLVDLCDARLLVHQGKTAQARECLEQIQRRLRDAGIEHLPATVTALAAEIERRT